MIFCNFKENLGIKQESLFEEIKKIAGQNSNFKLLQKKKQNEN